nr:SNF2-related protein [Christensenella tenuis]
MLFGGNTLLGHTVGAGKTFQIITAVQERKHFGMCSKAMICVPNHLLMQWSADYLRLYPAANILVVTARDFEKQRRRKFCARIATGEYDAVIIGHSQLQKIPMSKEWEEQHIQEQIDEIMDGIEEIKTEKGENWTVKQMEGARKALEERQQRINTMPRDDVLDFEELGIDMLVVDESQEFKNLAFTTKIRNVAGIAQGSAKRASDLFMKCRYLDKITGGRGIIFATGTPVSNAISELFTLQRYLQFDLLKEKGLAHFDAWVSVYAETKTAMELAPSGRGFRLKTRLSTYFNLNELCNMFALVADIKTAADINIPVPKIHGGEPENIVIPPTPLGEEIIESLVERSERIRKKQVSAFEDNMLLVTNDGRKAALDVRCFNALLPDEGGNKVEACVEKIYEIWKQYASERAAQLVFCDLSTPKELRMEKNMKGEYEAVESPFNVYQDIKNKLVKKGIPENEIAFIHDAKTDLQKAKLFAKVRKGAVRVLIGSTFKMGAGMNVQDRLVALHHLDAPWRPSDVGRILRTFKIKKNVEVTDNGKIII